MGIKAFFEQLFGKKKNGSFQTQSFGSVDQTRNEEGSRLVCVDCKSTFLFKSGERDFFKMRGLTPPKRCPSCRAKRKQRK